MIKWIGTSFAFICRSSLQKSSSAFWDKDGSILKALALVSLARTHNKACGLWPSMYQLPFSDPRMILKNPANPRKKRRKIMIY